MSVDVLLTVAVLVVLVVALAREAAPPAAVILGGLIALVLGGVIPAGEAFVGFSNSATVTIAGLFVVARALQEHAGIERGLARLLGSGRAGRASLARLVVPVVPASAVMANTPLVAALAPMVRTWAERHGRAPSQYLMPLSFAAILGGVITTIGTSTTLVVSGLVEESLGRGLGFLEVTPMGLPVAVGGTAVLLLLAPRALPDRRGIEAEVAAHERDYTFRMLVEPGGPLDGSTVRGAGLRNLESVFLARIDRDGHDIAPVGPDQLLEGGDLLTFVGRVEAVTGMQDRAGLVHTERPQTQLLDGDTAGHRFYDAVIGRDSYLAGRSLKEASFRGRYGGVVLAVHRAGERVAGKLGEVRLQPGDALLIQSDVAFTQRWAGPGDFALIAPLDDEDPEPSPRRRLVLVTALGMVGLAASGLVAILPAVLGACAVLLGTGTLAFHEARDALDLDVLLIVAGAIGIGAAVQAGGLAGVVGDGIAAVAAGGGPAVALATLVVGTLILTELITNVAAAALMVPLALSIAPAAGADPRTLAVAVAVAASASFLTPIGYQTNTMVYGLGGYHFGDYWRLGLPITLVVVAVTTTVGVLL